MRGWRLGVPVRRSEGRSLLRPSAAPLSVCPAPRAETASRSVAAPGPGRSAAGDPALRSWQSPDPGEVKTGDMPYWILE